MSCLVYLQTNFGAFVSKLINQAQTFRIQLSVTFRWSPINMLCNFPNPFCTNDKLGTRNPCPLYESFLKFISIWALADLNRNRDHKPETVSSS